MSRLDYQAVSDSIMKIIQNPEIRRIWRGLADAAIDQALADCLGMRVLEELRRRKEINLTKCSKFLNCFPREGNQCPYAKVSSDLAAFGRAC